MPCPSCGSELSAYPKNPTTEPPCPFCGYVGFASLPASFRQLISTRLATVNNAEAARVAVEELVAHLNEQAYDERTKFAARLAFEEAAEAAIRRDQSD